MVVPLEHDHLQLTLIDPGMPLPDLQRIALANRPDLASQAGAGECRGRAHSPGEIRPFLPIVISAASRTPGGMMTQAGIFGLGPNSSLNQWTGRADVSLQLVWQFDALGIGNLAANQTASAETSHKRSFSSTEPRTRRRGSTEAHADLQSATARVTQAERSLRTALTAYNGNVEGLRQTTRFGDTWSWSTDRRKSFTH